ncbi:hypothetical protein CAPTEDRAFT_198639 [Capitella teleta]|uniref:Uncharacterized protein n=1 Tax=Capitella teleta TaxID=283909 RepID=R7TAM8_CAPTE|nr:hypothetical protein CAPTEDRAFT_198639 [Capitella teleta]|eukprot:ELT88064.1 hypothetical protein CAPTEDRAFT_198639 [Capitella teleta]
MSSHGQQSLTVIPSSNISRFELNLDCCYTKLSDETQGSIRTILASFGKHVSRVCSVAIVEYTAKPKKSNEVLNLEYPYIDWGCLESVIKVPEPLPWAIATHHFHSFSFFGPRWQPVADSTIRLTGNTWPDQPLSVRSISIPLAYRSDDSNTSYSVTSGYEGSGGSITPRQRTSSSKRMKRGGPFEVFTQKRLNCKPSVPARTSPSNLSWDFDLASLSEPGSPSNKRGRNTICPSLLRQYNRLSKVSIPSKSMSQEGHLPFRSAPSAPRVPPPPRPGLGRKRSSFVKTSVANCHGVNKANKSVVDTDSPLDSPKPSTSKGHDVANVAMKGEYGSPRPSASPTASGVNRCGDSDETQMYEKNFRSRLGSGRTSEDGGRSRQGLTRRDTPKVKDVAAFDRKPKKCIEVRYLHLCQLIIVSLLGW